MRSGPTLNYKHRNTQHGVPWTSGLQEGHVGLNVNTHSYSLRGSILEKREEKKNPRECFHCVLLIKILQPGAMPLSCVAVCGLSDKVEIMKTNSSESMMMGRQRSAYRVRGGGWLQVRIPPTVDSDRADGLTASVF